MTQPTQPNQPGRGLPGLPGFQALPPDQQPDPDPPPQDQATPDQDQAAGGSGSGSSGGIRAPIPISKLRSKPYEAIAAGLLKAAGGLINSKLQAHDDDACFIPDEDDERDIPPPVGRLAARHIPISDKADLSELEDIGAAAVSILAWAAKGLVAMYEARRDKKRAKQAAVKSGAAYYDDAGTGEQDQP